MDLLEIAATFRDRGLKIYSVAGSVDEETVRACGEAGVPVLRTMLKLDPRKSYHENIDDFRNRCIQLTDVTADSGVSIGLQNHCDEFVSSSIGIMHAIEPLDERQVSAVLDLGHTGLEGEREDIAIDIAWRRLSMINLKNAIRVSKGRDALGVEHWERKWVLGREGFTSWKNAVDALRVRAYTGPICLTAEYKDDRGNALEGDAVVSPLKEDLSYLRELLSRK